MRWMQRWAAGKKPEATACLVGVTKLLEDLAGLEAQLCVLQQEAELLSEIQPPDHDAYLRMHERELELRNDCEDILIGFGTPLPAYGSYYSCIYGEFCFAC